MNQRKLRALLICSSLAGAAVLSPIFCWAQSPPAGRDAKATTQITNSDTEAHEDKLQLPDQTISPQPTPSSYDNSLGLDFAKHVAWDQKNIWSSPARLRWRDADWILPLGATTGILLATDRDVSRHLSNSPGRLNYSKDVSNYGLASLVATGGGMYLWGHFTHNEHRRETGLLAGEAALDSLAVVYATKYALGRERPGTDGDRGRFWNGGDSFPSTHAAAAWSIAGVIAHEYPGPVPTLLSYGIAAAISTSRVSAKQHFPSDVLIGSAVGFLVAQQVYRHHHNPELGGRDWETYSEAMAERADRGAGHAGSPYVELDSWIYPAIERLAALGYIHNEFLGIRPWTRLQCEELVEEAGDSIRADVATPDGSSEIYSALVNEFEGDLSARDEGNRSARIESIYAGATGISGEPLHDSSHFGQTITNNFGRPYQEGLNSYDGFSGYATAGRFAIYVRGEYQHAPSASGYSLAVRQAIATADVNPLQPAIPIDATDQFRLLDAYVDANYGDINFSFGKQSLWWGPEEGSSLILSDNAEPMYMFRMHPEHPFEIPGLSRVLGPFETDFFVGKLSGNEFPPRPAIHGEKISFRPTHDLEFGFSRLVEFGGVGRPLTAGAIWNSYVSTKSSVNYRASVNPGKRTSDFDFSYRPPLVRNWVTLYGESLAADDVVPLESLPRAAWNSGIYMPRLPYFPRFDLRLEGGYTDPVTPRSNGGDYIYWDLFYHDLSTNKNNLIGSWIGREGKGVEAVSTYSISSRTNIQFRYRQAKVAKDFIPRGETVNDGSAKVNLWLHEAINISAEIQYEKWFAPALAPGPQTNWTSSFQISFWPRTWGVRSGGQLRDTDNADSESKAPHGK